MPNLHFDPTSAFRNPSTSKDNFETAKRSFRTIYQIPRMGVASPKFAAPVLNY